MNKKFKFTVVIILTIHYISQARCFKSDNLVYKQLNNDDFSCHGRITFENVTLTAYYPNEDEENLDAKGHPFKTLQEFLDDNADYVTVSMDEALKIPYGTTVCIPQLNAHYRRQIKLQVRDTANNVKGQGYKRVDICVRSEADSYDHAVNLKDANVIF